MSADHRTIANALRLAAGCIADARLLADSGSRNAAYLSEQALEQLIRASATSEGIHIERQDAHQLDKTLRRFPAENSELAVMKSLVWLEAYATTFRYTTPSGNIPNAPDIVKLRNAIECLDDLVSRLAVHFGVDLVDGVSPAQTTAPPR